MFISNSKFIYIYISYHIISFNIISYVCLFANMWVESKGMELALDQR